MESHDTFFALIAANGCTSSAIMARPYSSGFIVDSRTVCVQHLLGSPYGDVPTLREPFCQLNMAHLKR